MHRRRPPQLALPLPPDPVLVEALRAAQEIRERTDGPSPAPWRVLRLAQALRDAS